MPDLEKRAITRFGLSFSEFWDSTPREYDMLVEQKVYQDQQEMNRVRHIMVTIANSNVSKKKKPQGYSLREMIYLPLIDGLSEDRVKTEQKKAEDGLARMKKRIQK